MYFAALIAMFTACSEPMDQITGIDYPSAFSPIGLKVELGTFDKATVRWDVIDDARSYVVQLSQNDKLEFNDVITYETELLEQLLTDLWGETSYSVRVKSKAFNEGQEDSKWYGMVFRTNAEQIFKTVAADDIKTSQIIVRWEPNAEVTHLIVSQGIGEIILTQAEKAAGEKRLTGLIPDAEHTISIYNGEQRRGVVTAKTKWRPHGEGVIEVQEGDDLRAITENVANIGKIIYLPESFIYELPDDLGMLIAGTMSLYGDPDAEDKPKIKFFGDGGKRCFILPENAETILFTNIAIEGNPTQGNCVVDQYSQGTDPKCANLKEINFPILITYSWATSTVTQQTVIRSVTNSYTPRQSSYDESLLPARAMLL